MVEEEVLTEDDVMVLELVKELDTRLVELVTAWEEMSDMLLVVDWLEIYTKCYSNESI